jgi:hypothetical protein
MSELYFSLDFQAIFLVQYRHLLGLPFSHLVSILIATRAPAIAPPCYIPAAPSRSPQTCSHISKGIHSTKKSYKQNEEENSEFSNFDNIHPRTSMTQNFHSHPSASRIRSRIFAIPDGLLITNKHHKFCENLSTDLRENSQ